jgi:hypothetical protein
MLEVKVCRSNTGTVFYVMRCQSCKTIIRFLRMCPVYCKKCSEEIGVNVLDLMEFPEDRIDYHWVGEV